MKSLSVCIISKNEEANIERCLKSIKKLADEIIVVDTGSTDNTIKLARRNGAKVVKTIWENDFSKARNLSLDNATKDWVLIIDCDETIPKSEHSKIKSLLNSKDFEAFNFKLQNLENNENKFGATVLRLFKNKKEYRFRGRIHEQIANSIISLAGNNSIANTDIIIKHYGYDKELVDLEAKNQRNLDLLLSYKEEEKTPYYYYSLANEYYRMKDYDTATKNYKNAMQIVNLEEGLPLFYPYLANNMINIYYNKKMYTECILIIQKFKEEISDFKYLPLMEAICYFDIGKLTFARNALDEYFDIYDEKYEYPRFEVMEETEIIRLKNHLENVALDFDEGNLTVWIPMQSWDDDVLECIKSINEIAGQIIIITCENKNIDIFKNYGAEVLLTDMFTYMDVFVGPSKLTKKKNVLILLPFETVSKDSLIQLTNYLNDEDAIAKMSYIRTLNKTKDRYKEEVRLIQNNPELLNRRTYDEYFTNDKIEIFDTEIYINSDFID